MEQMTKAELLARIYAEHSKHPLVLELANRFEDAEDALAPFQEDDQPTGENT